MVEFFGTGRALRQYVYVHDVARVIARLLETEPPNTDINIAPTENRSIADLAHAVGRVAGYGGDIVFTGDGPDGQLRKDVATNRLRQIIPDWGEIETDLDRGLTQTIDWYRDNVEAG
jgi:GDP-L-fucose synthase